MLEYRYARYSPTVKLTPLCTVNILSVCVCVFGSMISPLPLFSFIQPLAHFLLLCQVTERNQLFLALIFFFSTSAQETSPDARPFAPIMKSTQRSHA